MISDRKKTYLMLCLSLSHPCLFLPSPLLFLPPSLSLVVWRRSVGAERSRLVKRLADDRKIRGISLLTGCCVCARFSPLFFCFKCFLSVCFQSSCLGSTIKCNRCTRIHTRSHAPKLTQMQKHMCRFCCVLIGSDLRSQIGGNGRRERSSLLTKTSSPSLIIETGFDYLFGNSFSNSCNDDD